MGIFRNKKGKGVAAVRLPVDLSGLDFVCQSAQAGSPASDGAFSTWQVELPSRRWLRMANENGKPQKRSRL